MKPSSSRFITSALQLDARSRSTTPARCIHIHKGEPGRAISEVRDWLANVSKTKALPGGVEIADRYKQFNGDLPAICESLKRHPKEQTFADYSETVEIWLKSSR